MRFGFFIVLAVSCGLSAGCQMSVIWPSKAKSVQQSFDPFLDEPAEHADANQQPEDVTDAVMAEYAVIDDSGVADQEEVADQESAPELPGDTIEFPIGVVGQAESAATRELAAEREAVEAEIASTMLLLAEKKRQAAIESEQKSATSKSTSDKAELEATPEVVEARQAIQQAFTALGGELANPESRIGIVDEMPSTASDSMTSDSASNQSTDETTDSPDTEDLSQGASE